MSTVEVGHADLERYRNLLSAGARKEVAEATARARDLLVRIPVKAISRSGVFDQVLSEAAERPTQRSDQPLKFTSFESIVG